MAFPPCAKRKALEARSSTATLGKSRGRIERRRLTATTVGIDTCDWPAVKQFLGLERITTIKGETKSTVSYAITSLRPENASAKQRLQFWRDRWAIENRLFRVKDAVIREDHSRTRTGHAARAMSVIRNAIVNYFRTYDNPCIAAELRANVLQLDALLAKLGILKL